MPNPLVNSTSVLVPGGGDPPILVCKRPADPLGDTVVVRRVVESGHARVVFDPAIRWHIGPDFVARDALFDIGTELRRPRQSLPPRQTAEIVREDRPAADIRQEKPHKTRTAASCRTCVPRRCHSVARPSNRRRPTSMRPPSPSTASASVEGSGTAASMELEGTCSVDRIVGSAGTSRNRPDRGSVAVQIGKVYA